MPEVIARALTAPADITAASKAAASNSSSTKPPTILRQKTLADVATTAHISTQLGRRVRERSNSPKTVPRAAKGSSSIQQLKDMVDLEPKFKLMRYPVRREMPLYQKVWMTLDDPCYVNHDAPGGFKKLSSYYAYFSIFLILFSSTTFTLQSEINCMLKHDYSSPLSQGQGDPDAPRGYGHSFVTAENCATWDATWAAIEVFAVTCFTLELLLRFATAPDKRVFLQSGFNWIDLMAVAPFFLESIVMGVRNSASSSSVAVAALNATSNGTLAAGGSDGDVDPVLQTLQVLRVLRLARVFKLLKMGNASASLQLVSATAGAALADSFKILLALLMVTVICMIVFAAALAQFEPGSNYLAPRSDSTGWFLSITRTCWWSLVTLTGVGYGDEYPMFAVGRIIAMICATVGILIVAVPIEVIGRYFGQHFQRHTYSRAMEDECEQEGQLDIPLFYEKLKLLGKQGLLKVNVPETIEELREVVARYDGKGDCMLEHDEWAALIDDVVAMRGDWEGCAMRKTADLMMQTFEDVGLLKQELKMVCQRRSDQLQELCQLAKERRQKLGLPAGVPITPQHRPRHAAAPVSIPVLAPVASKPK